MSLAVAAPSLSPEQLDELYSGLCARLTRIGEAHAPLYLARFALLAMVRLGDAQAIATLLDDAADGLSMAADATPG